MENNTEPKKIKDCNIWEKIWAVQKEVKALIKDEETKSTNKMTNYKYFEENQVLKVLKPLLERYRLALAIRDNITSPPIYEKEGNNYLVKYLKTMTIVNIDKENEKVNYGFWACGSNFDLAKAKGSAETYAMKYILSKFFLIRVLDENDPELKETESKK